MLSRSSKARVISTKYQKTFHDDLNHAILSKHLAFAFPTKTPNQPNPKTINKTNPQNQPNPKTINKTNPQNQPNHQKPNPQIFKQTPYRPKRPTKRSASEGSSWRSAASKWPTIRWSPTKIHRNSSLIPSCSHPAGGRGVFLFWGEIEWKKCLRSAWNQSFLETCFEKVHWRVEFLRACSISPAIFPWNRCTWGFTPAGCVFLKQKAVFITPSRLFPGSRAEVQVCGSDDPGSALARRAFREDEALEENVWGIKTCFFLFLKLNMVFNIIFLNVFFFFSMIFLGGV